MLTAAQWQQYRDIVNSLHDSFNQDDVIWGRFSRSIQRFGEDTKTNEHYVNITLKALISYNVFRTWPITQETKIGTSDKESILMILNNQYLIDNGYMNQSGFFDLNPGKDTFTHKGILYRSAGETQASQAGDTTLFTFVILKREEIQTGQNKY